MDEIALGQFGVYDLGRGVPKPKTSFAYRRDLMIEARPVGQR